MRSDATAWRAKPSPHRAGQGPARLLVRSIGTAGVALVHSLRRVLPFSDAEIAALLFQAPSVLLSGLERSKAEAIADILRETGLDCAVLDAHETVEEGVGDHEVALSLRDMARMPAVLVEVVRLLGVDAVTARNLICDTPATLVGGVSAATVETLRARFAALGAELDASQPARAHFDVFLGECAPSLRERLVARLRTLAGDEARIPATGPVVVSGLDHGTAERLWRELRQLDVPARVINRDFARYDVVLQAAEDVEAVRRHLRERAGIPEAVIPRVLANLPVVIHPGLPHARLEDVFVELTAAGARAIAEPLAFQRFAVTLGEVRDPGALVPVLSSVGGLDEAGALSALRARPARLRGPFTPVQARWLQCELKRAGMDARLEAV